MTGRLRQVAVLGASGAVLGLVVGLAYRLVVALRDERTVTTYHGSYVPMQGLEMSKAYESTLSITVDPPGGGWAELIGVCVGIGLVLGLAAAGVLALAGRRIALVSASSPTG